MKKLAVITTCILLTLYACTKSAIPNYGSLYATVDNVADTFSTNVLAINDSSAGTYRLSVVGFQGALGDSTKGGFESAEMGFEIRSPRPITTGTYVTDSSTGNSITMIYTPAQLARYDSVLTGTANQPSITINKVSTGSVQGTFSGFSFYTDSGVVKRSVITNGKFDVNLQ